MSVGPGIVRRVRRSPGRLAVTVLAVLGVVVACSRGPRRMNVVFVGIDTLRADHLGCYGYGRPTSPRIDALAQKSVVFEQAIAQSPWTLPAFASMFTGMIPGRHGAGRGKACASRPCEDLAADVSTLAELFARAGYRTGSFVSNGFARVGGLSRGYEQVETGYSGTVAVRAGIRWLERHRDEPVFLFVHIVDPHEPYTPPADDAAPFLDPQYAGPVTPANAHLVQRDWTDADRRRVIDLYDGEVHCADRLTGLVLDAIARLGIEERTLVVVAADHGEELFERGELGHGHTMYDELLHVPLVLRFPGGAPHRRVPDQVRTMDVFATILAAAGIAPPPGIDAVDLTALARGGPAPPATGRAVAEFTFRGPEQRALREPSEKLVFDVANDRVQLFDLVADPGERHDVATARPDRARELQTALAATDASTETAPGLYVMIQNGRDPHRVTVVLSAPATGFTAAVLESAEPDDAVQLSADRRVATVDMRLSADDADGARLVTDATGLVAVMVTSMTVDGRAFGLERLMLGSKPAPRNARLPLLLTPRRVAVHRASMPRTFGANPWIAIQAVLPSARPALRIDPKTQEHLRALGYAD